jgi:FMN phosphatase YigB (HAD superfamily)
MAAVNLNSAEEVQAMLTELRSDGSKLVAIIINGGPAAASKLRGHSMLLANCDGVVEIDSEGFRITKSKNGG